MRWGFISGESERTEQTPATRAAGSDQPGGGSGRGGEGGVCVSPELITVGEGVRSRLQRGGNKVASFKLRQTEMALIKRQRNLTLI